MFSTKYFVKMLATVTLVTLIASCSDNETVIAETATAKAQPIMLDVYKSPTCGCCKKWINHIDDNGFQSNKPFSALNVVCLHFFASVNVERCSQGEVCL